MENDKLLLGKDNPMACRTPNEHIAKIAALPRVDKKSVFSRSLLALIKCWEAATSAICHHVRRQRGTARWIMTTKREKER